MGAIEGGSPALMAWAPQGLGWEQGPSGEGAHGPKSSSRLTALPRLRVRGRGPTLPAPSTYREPQVPQQRPVLEAPSCSGPPPRKLPPGCPVLPDLGLFSKDRGERRKARDRGRDRDRDKRHRDRETQREGQRQRDRQRLRDKDRHRERDTENQTDRHRETESEEERNRDQDRETFTERQTDRDEAERAAVRTGPWAALELHHHILHFERDACCVQSVKHRSKEKWRSPAWL